MIEYMTPIERVEAQAVILASQLKDVQDALAAVLRTHSSGGREEDICYCDHCKAARSVLCSTGYGR